MTDYIPTVYLAGPVQHADDGGHDWRDMVIERFGDQFEFNNPLDKYDSHVSEVVWLQTDEVPEDYPDDVEVVYPEEVIAADKAMIDDSDAVLVGLQEMVPMYGTPREHEYAYQTGKPIVVWHGNDMTLPIWTIGDSALLSSNLQHCLEHILSSHTRHAVEQDVVGTIMENL